MKEIHVFHVRWLVSDKGAEPTAACGSGNPSQRCLSLLMYSICFGALHTPDSAAAPSGTSRIPSGKTHSDGSRNASEAAVPIILPASNGAVAAELQVEAGGFFFLHFNLIFSDNKSISQIVSCWKKLTDNLGEQQKWRHLRAKKKIPPICTRLI